MNQPPALAPLLALFLAIRDPEVTLNSKELEELFIIGEQLELKPHKWDTTQAKLMSMIKLNPKLNESFTKYQAALIGFLASESIDNADWWPTQEELLEKIQAGKQNPTTSKIETLGEFRKKAQRSQNYTIINSVLAPILKSENPAAVSKTLFQSLLEKLSQFSANSDTIPPTLPPLI